jgi:hypothetical protein
MISQWRFNYALLRCSKKDLSTKELEWKINEFDHEYFYENEK